MRGLERKAKEEQNWPESKHGRLTALLRPPILSRRSISRTHLRVRHSDAESRMVLTSLQVTPQARPQLVLEGALTSPSVLPTLPLRARPNPAPAAPVPIVPTPPKASPLLSLDSALTRDVYEEKPPPFLEEARSAAPRRSPPAEALSDRSRVCSRWWRCGDSVRARPSRGREELPEKAEAE